MRRRIVLGQLAVFGVISVVIIGYTLIVLLKFNPTTTPFRVSVQLRSAGGIFAGAEVAYRGVQVGKVESVDLQTSGVTVKLSLYEGTKVPDNASAHVYDLSAVGEQYVDLTPPKIPSTSYLHGGSEIPQSRTSTPIETASVIFDLERFVNSINPKDLQILGREGALAFQGTGPQLRSILVNATEIVDQLSSSEDNMLDLLHNGSILLDGLASHASAFDSFTRSLRLVSSTLAAKTPTITRLLADASPTTQLVNKIVVDNGAALTTLLANGATFTDIQVVRVPGLRALLVAVPEFGRLAPTVVHNGSLLGVANINQSQPLCNTGLPLSNPLSAHRTKLYGVSCGAGIARGAANAPRPATSASTTSADTQQLGASAQPAGSRTQVGTYNAQSGLVSASDGRLVRLGTTGGQQRLLGGNSWQAMLLAVTGN